MSYGNDPAGEQGYGTGQQYGAPPPSPYPPPPPADYGQPNYGQPPGSPPPPTYQAWTIVAMICGILFSLILGFPAAIAANRYGRNAKQEWQNGDTQAAIKASHRARTWLIVAFVLDVLGLVLVILIRR